VLTYWSIDSFEKGIVFELLWRSFKPLMNPEFETKLKQYDKEVFEHTQTVGACIFLTRYENQLIGMASWDPRQFPRAIVGNNCVLPEFQGKGFGKQQMVELLRRLRTYDFVEATVTTGDHPFFIPAQKMYLSCGFQEVRRYNEGGDPRYGSIEYCLVLSSVVERNA